jgi:hypothetical protein
MRRIPDVLYRHESQHWNHPVLTGGFFGGLRSGSLGGGSLTGGFSGMSGGSSMGGIPGGGGGSGGSSGSLTGGFFGRLGGSSTGGFFCNLILSSELLFISKSSIVVDFLLYKFLWSYQ